MSENETPSQSPLLDHCPPGLPARAYFDADWHRREMEHIWRREWIYAGRKKDFAAGTLSRITIAGQAVVIAAARDGGITAFHNTCRHRGAELCEVAQKPFNGALITCPYHGWAYDVQGRLISTAFATPTPDFDKSDHGLFAVNVTIWNGGVYLCLAEDAPEFAPDMGLNFFDNWPMADLVTGHSAETTLACNWKIFWENYNECLHCPSVHPELSERVPVYRKGIMSEPEARDWSPWAKAGPALKEGTVSWTVNGRACGPVFPDLTAAERSGGHHFATLYPTSFVVAHVDYVRVVSLMPLGPETTRLNAQWLFSPQTLDAKGFDLANVVDFATQVLAQDGAACEMNQRGLKSNRFLRARLMPQEFELHRFHQWVAARIGETL